MLLSRWEHGAAVRRASSLSRTPGASRSGGWPVEVEKAPDSRQHLSLALGFAAQRGFERWTRRRQSVGAGIQSLAVLRCADRRVVCETRLSLLIEKYRRNVAPGRICLGCLRRVAGECLPLRCRLRQMRQSRPRPRTEFPGCSASRPHPADKLADWPSPGRGGSAGPRRRRRDSSSRCVCRYRMHRLFSVLATKWQIGLRVGLRRVATDLQGLGVGVGRLLQPLRVPVQSTQIV